MPADNAIAWDNFRLNPDPFLAPLYKFPRADRQHAEHDGAMLISVRQQEPA